MKKSRVTTNIPGNIFLFVFAVICAFPFYWAVNSSFKTEGDMFLKDPQWYPHNPTLMNFRDMFAKTNFPQWGLNSIIVGVTTTVLVCILAGFAGYALSKIRFPGSTVIFGAIVATMMLPKYSMLIPLYTIMKKLGWFNTYYGLIVPEIAFQLPFGIFMIRQFCMGIPDDLYEAATLDGANELQLFFKITVPLLKPAIASLTILTFVRVWNDYMWQLLVSTKRDMMTVPVGLASIQTEIVQIYGQTLAGAIVSALPLIVVFIAFQKYFVKGISAGAVKG